MQSNPVENDYIMREERGISYRSPLNLNPAEHRAIAATDDRQHRRSDMADQEAQKKLQDWLQNLLAFQAREQQPVQQQVQEQRQDLEPENKQAQRLGL